MLKYVFSATITLKGCVTVMTKYAFQTTKLAQLKKTAKIIRNSTLNVQMT